MKNKIIATILMIGAIATATFTMPGLPKETIHLKDIQTDNTTLFPGGDEKLAGMWFVEQVETPNSHS